MTVPSRGGSWVVGIDVGGNFTDVVAVDQASGARHVTKLPSTPDQSARAMLAFWIKAWRSKFAMNG